MLNNAFFIGVGGAVNHGGCVDGGDVTSLLVVGVHGGCRHAMVSPLEEA